MIFDVDGISGVQRVCFCLFCIYGVFCLGMNDWFWSYGNGLVA